MATISLRRKYCDLLSRKGLKLRHSCNCGGGISSFTKEGNNNWVRVYERGHITINKDKKEGQILATIKLSIDENEVLEQIKNFIPSI